MKFIEIQNEKIPALGFGTWQMTGDECTQSVSDALAIGYRHIDTAQAYNNEKEVGAGIKQSDVPRDKIWLTTKIWVDNLSYDRVIASTEESLYKLQTDYVDLLLIHWPSNKYAMNNTLRALDKLKTMGKTRYIGVSNFPTSMLSSIVEMGKSVLCNQIEYHPFLNQDRVLKYCRNHHMFVTAYSPLARGDVFKSDTIKDMAQKHGKSEAQITLKWLIDQKNVAAIPKAATHEHAESNFNIFDIKLSMEEKNTIGGLRGNHRLIDPAWAPKWDPIHKETMVA